MTPQQFRPIILKTLRDSQSTKFRTVEELADRLVERMQDFEEMVNLAFNLSTPAQPLSPPEVSMQTPQNVIVAPAQDISERLTADAGQGLVERYSKDQLWDYYSSALPQQVQVTPPGFNKPLQLQRWMKRAPGDLGFVRIGYVPPGSDPETESAQMQVATTDASLDAERLLRQLIDQANKIFSPTRRQVQPVRNFPVYESLEQTLSVAISAETDRETSTADMAEWSRAISGPKLNFQDASDS